MSTQIRTMTLVTVLLSSLAISPATAQTAAGHSKMSGMKMFARRDGGQDGEDVAR